MRSHPPVAAVILLFALVLLPRLDVLAQTRSAGSEDLKANKKAVERYFSEFIDRMGVGDAPQEKWPGMADQVGKVCDELFAEGAVHHFPGLPPSAPKGLVNIVKLGINKSMVTTIHHIVAEGNLVVAHVSHDLTPKPGTPFMSPRIKCAVPTKGNTIHWEAMAIFKFRNGKIVEEWISRDDLGSLLQLGKITFEPCGPMPGK
jgi:hypothetical protein